MTLCADSTVGEVITGPGILTEPQARGSIADTAAFIAVFNVSSEMADIVVIIVR